MIESFRKAWDEFNQHHGVLRTGQAKKLGIDPKTLSRMKEEGIIVQEARGLYRLASLPPLSHPDFVQIALRVPQSVICLISALYFHGLTTQLPYKVYFAIPQGVKVPRIDYPPIDVVSLTRRTYSQGIEKHILDNVEVRIYSKEKTVADCFKFRNKIGSDIAVEALKEYLHKPGADLENLLHYAKIDRIETILRPYIEAILG